jgi:hypothetical protein
MATDVVAETVVAPVSQPEAAPICCHAKRSRRKDDAAREIASCVKAPRAKKVKEEAA